MPSHDQVPLSIQEAGTGRPMAFACSEMRGRGEGALSESKDTACACSRVWSFGVKDTACACQSAHRGGLPLPNQPQPHSAHQLLRPSNF